MRYPNPKAKSIPRCFEDFIRNKKFWWIPDLEEQEYTQEDLDRLLAISIIDAQLFIKLGLANWQNVFRIGDLNYPHKLYFPNVISLAPGDKIQNITKNESYVIDRIKKDINGVFTGHVYLKSSGTIGPNDRLEIPENRTILFFAAFPSVEEKKTIIFDEAGKKIDLQKPPRPIMTYRIVREEFAPHNGNQKFGDVYQYIVPKVYAKYDDPTDINYLFKLYTKESALLVQYNGWTETNAQSDKLYYLFQSFQEVFRSVLISYGILDMRFEGRTDDRFINYWAPTMNSRNLTYYYRTATITKRRERKPTSIDTTISIT